MASETTEKTKQYRLLTGRHSMGGKIYIAGTPEDIITLTEEQAGRFSEGRLEEAGVKKNTKKSKGSLVDKISDKLSSLSEDQLREMLRMLEENKDASSTESETSTGTKIDMTDTKNGQEKDKEIDVEDLLLGSIPEIKTEVKGINSLDDLDTIYQAESSGRQRTGVFNLLIERKNELEGK